MTRRSCGRTARGGEIISILLALACAIGLSGRIAARWGSQSRSCVHSRAGGPLLHLRKRTESGGDRVPVRRSATVVAQTLAGFDVTTAAEGPGFGAGVPGRDGEHGLPAAAARSPAIPVYVRHVSLLF